MSAPGGDEAARVRAHGYVEGRVQGVWFRESTRRRASELGLSGWVRNLSDGRVEATFEGARSDVEQAVAFVREGPPHARVDAVNGFEIERLGRDEADSDEANAAFLIR
ncbi:MAG: acylphosphatase [Myxococcota bacterium]|jgi:acylphosphatase|nr:acylphosphatase [Myxococcota bacterium]